VIDLFEEARAVEMDERLHTERRGHFSPGELVRAATVAGHRSLGWPDAGAIAAGQRADLVTVRLDTVRTAGAAPSAVFFAAGAADVSTVVVDGRVVVRDGQHVRVDAAAELARAVGALW
jgi:cytosine/adenosine deaminase-related metal-dependent hydrolase